MLDDQAYSKDLNERIQRGLAKQKLEKEAKSKIAVGTGGSPSATYMIDPSMDFASGGILANSPVTRVNDMILTADGKMIETHPDDNIIAKKGGITQKSGGGSSRVEQLLEGILHAVQESGDTYIDGAKVSAAINSVNHNV